MSLRVLSASTFGVVVAGCAVIDTGSHGNAPGYQEGDRPGFGQLRDIRPSRPTPTFGSKVHSDNCG